MLYRWLLILSLGAFLVYWLRGSKPPETAMGDNTVWAVNTEGLKERLEKNGMDVLTKEGTALHTHQHLDIWIDGKKIDVPAEIGVGPNESFISPLHTHETDGIIHVESDKIEDFTLGQFFKVWGVPFSDICIGDYCRTADKSLRMFVNGKEIENNFADLKLEAHQEIALYYGSEVDTSKVPTSYEFPKDY